MGVGRRAGGGGEGGRREGRGVRGVQAATERGGRQPSSGQKGQGRGVSLCVAAVDGLCRRSLSAARRRPVSPRIESLTPTIRTPHPYPSFSHRHADARAHASPGTASSRATTTLPLPPPPSTRPHRHREDGGTRTSPRTSTVSILNGMSRPPPALKMKKPSRLRSAHQPLTYTSLMGTGRLRGCTCGEEGRGGGGYQAGGGVDRGEGRGGEGFIAHTPRPQNHTVDR